MLVVGVVSIYVLQSLSASVMPCNDGLDTHAALCPLYEGKDQDGKSRFEPVAIASTHASSVGVTVHYHTSLSVSVSNCIICMQGSMYVCPYVVCCNSWCLKKVIVFMHYIRIIISLPCPRVTVYYVISARYH